MRARAMDNLELSAASYQTKRPRATPYSHRSAVTGSTRAARRAGTQAATRATSSNATETAPKVRASVGLTSNSSERSSRVRPNAPIRPDATPATARRSACHATIPTVFAWTRYFGDAGKAAVTLDAILGSMPTLPSWGYNGCARRYWDFQYAGKIKRIERQLHHYGSGLNAIPVLTAYRDHPDDLYLLRVGYGGLMG